MPAWRGAMLSSSPLSGRQVRLRRSCSGEAISMKKGHGMSQDVEEARAAAVRRFLRETDHALDRAESQYAGTLNPALRPRPDKRYPTLAPRPLPDVAELAPSTISALTAIADAGEGGTAA